MSGESEVFLSCVCSISEFLDIRLVVKVNSLKLTAKNAKNAKEREFSKLLKIRLGIYSIQNLRRKGDICLSRSKKPQSWVRE